MSEFISFSICVCPRNCNKSADAIAAYGCRVSSDDQVTWDDVPRFVEGLVATDLAEPNE
jgi:hypothetical protein